MIRKYEINKQTYEVEYNDKYEPTSITPNNPILTEIRPEDFKYVGATEQVGKTTIKLVAEKDGILLTDILEKTFLLEFYTNETVTSSMKELVRYPPIDDFDEDEEFFKLEEDGTLLETYNYGGDESVAHDYYWNHDNLQQWYCDLDLNKSKEFREDGYMGLKLTCIDQENFYPHEKNL